MPLTKNVIDELFGWLSSNTSLPKRRGRQHVNGIDDEEEPDDGYEEPDEVIDLTIDDVFSERKITISASCMQGYKLALLWWYREKSVVINSDINDHLNAFIKGYEVTIAKKKATGVMSITEGKSALSFAGYVEICKVMMRLAPNGNRNPFSEGIFGWTYMVFMWNLIARAESVGNIMLQHIDWREDAVIVTFARHKGDQTGEGLSNYTILMNHLYSQEANRPGDVKYTTLANRIYSKPPINLQNVGNN